MHNKQLKKELKAEIKRLKAAKRQKRREEKENRKKASHERAEGRHRRKVARDEYRRERRERRQRMKDPQYIADKKARHAQEKLEKKLARQALRNSKKQDNENLGGISRLFKEKVPRRLITIGEREAHRDSVKSKKFNRLIATLGRKMEADDNRRSKRMKKLDSIRIKNAM